MLSKNLGLLEKSLSGDKRSIGKLLTLIESPSKENVELIHEIIKRGGKAQIIGITGAPGAGKSSLISKIISEFRKRGYKVAVIAIDPTSPFTSGAFLGDRVRMQKHATDPHVFIRSLASRGLKGGLSLATLLTLETFDALDYDKIIVETVGAGQVDIDIFFAAMSIVVVTLPAAGDEIQALKAGLMEIGDIYAVNKADKLDAEDAIQQLKFALEAGEFPKRSKWVPRIVKTSALTGEGVSEIVDALDEHFDYLKKSGTLFELIKSRRAHLTKVLLHWLVRREVDKKLESFSEILEKVRNGEKDPVSAALDIYYKIFSR